MFRANALGSFKDILLNVTQDPAMLVWLNGNQNVKGKPNENYGREMMELFTLGANRGAYTETDVREHARALTGWQGSVVNKQPTALHLQRRSPRHRHEDDLRPDRQLRLAGLLPALPLTHPLHPSYFVTKLWSYFIPTTPGSASTVQGLQTLYANRKMLPVVEAILTHPDFYNGPRMVKPPVVLNAGLLRMVGRYIDTSVWWSLSAQAGPAALLSARRRRLGRHALARHRDLPRPLVHLRRRAGRGDADRHARATRR